MNKFYLIALILGFSFTSQAQNTVVDSVFMGAGYADEVYYSLSEGEIAKAPVKNWDLAFASTGAANVSFLSILANHSNGVHVYKYIKGDTTHWNSFDTTGWENWTEVHNSDTSWIHGAFNREPDAHPVYSWGIYTNSGEITGDSLFLLGFSENAFTPPTSFMKFWIVQKKSVSGDITFTFRFGSLDGTVDKTVTLDPADYPNTNFMYYSLREDKALNREPNNADWDFVITRYWALQPTEQIYYQVTGVLNNFDVVAAEARDVDLNTVSHTDYTSDDYETNISVIGWDWKDLDENFVWFIEDSLCYFVKDKEPGNIWKLVFTDFGGTTDGKVEFNKTALTTVGMEDINAPIGNFAVYPNPAAEQVSLIFENRFNQREVQVSVYDLSGKKMMQTAWDQAAGLNQETLDISNLPDGMYIVNLEADGYRLVNRLVKR